MLPALGLRALLVPIHDSLIGDTVFVVQNLFSSPLASAQDAIKTHIGTRLENLGERLDDACVLVRVDLHGVDERDLCLGAVAEGLEDVCKVLGKKLSGETRRVTEVDGDAL